MNNKPAKSGAVNAVVVVDQLSVVPSPSGSATETASEMQGQQADVFLPPPAVPKTRFAKRKGEQQTNASAMKKVKSAG